MLRIRLLSGLVIEIDLSTEGHLVDVFLPKSKIEDPDDIGDFDRYLVLADELQPAS